MAGGSGPPFFIVGSARSGTTFLRLTMNAHPEVAVPPESRFVTELMPPGGEIEAGDLLARLAEHPRFIAWELPVEEVRARLERREAGGAARLPYADAIDATFLAYAEAHGKTRWGDKTPRYVERLPEIAGLFPDARFIHLIRDGREVALSYADVPFGPKNIARAARLWADRVRKGMRDGRALGSGRYVEVLYTDLVRHTERIVRELCSFLDLSFDPVMLDTERHKEGALARADRFNPHVKEDAVRRTRSWETDMPADHVEVFEAIAGDVLSEVGFPRRYPAPSAAARAKAALGLRGLPVGRLRSSRRP